MDPSIIQSQSWLQGERVLAPADKGSPAEEDLAELSHRLLQAAFFDR